MMNVMINKSIKYWCGLLFGIVFLSGCHYAEMMEYSDIPRICFVGMDARGNDIYESAYLKASTNFAESLKGDTLQCDTLQVIVRLMGDRAVSPLQVYLASEAVGGSEQPDFVFFNPYVLTDSVYRAVLKIGVNRPAERNKEYKANLVFDFGQSDVAGAIDSLLHYPVTVTDAVTWEMLQITEEDWKNYIQPSFGIYSDTKARFMIQSMKTTNFSLLTYSWNVARYKNMCVAALEEYNRVNPDQLRDEEGNIITFDPA